MFLFTFVIYYSNDTVLNFQHLGNFLIAGGYPVYFNHKNLYASNLVKTRKRDEKFTEMVYF